MAQGRLAGLVWQGSAGSRGKWRGEAGEAVPAATRARRTFKCSAKDDDICAHCGLAEELHKEDDLPNMLINLCPE